jgi:rubrerythrin
MTEEQETVLEALRLAIQMENEGRQCYLEGAVQSTNEAGRRLLGLLAYEEDVHRQRLQEIYEAIRARKSWPEVGARPDATQKLRESFNTTCELLGANVSAATEDFRAIETAVEKEKESYDFYMRRSNTAAYAAEKEFYRTVAAEEREHELILLDYYEYLRDPAGFFTKLEHHSLDGA